MQRTGDARSIRLELRKCLPAARAAASTSKARNAEELADVESAVSRASLLLRRTIKAAA
jgi:hypothetical protein